MPSKLSRSLKAVRRAGPAGCLAALEAAAWLGIARLMVVAVPFRTLSRFLTRPIPDSPRTELARTDSARRVGWAVNAAGRRAPWRCKCLERAIAAKLMLRLRGHGSTLFLGVARPETGAPVQAHAWLRCAALPVVGEEGSPLPYSVVARFADPVGGSRRA